MAEKESAMLKHHKELQEKAKAYKTPHDVERVHHIIAAASLMRDYPAVSALQGSLLRELNGYNLKQVEQDAKDKYEDEKAWMEARAADAPKPEPEPAEESHANPRRK